MSSALLLSTCFAFAQTLNNNIVVFSQDGDKFSLIVNGLKQNEKPETHEDVIDFNATSRILPLDFVYIGPNLNYKVGLGKLKDDMNFELDFPMIIEDISIDNPTPD